MQSGLVNVAYSLTKGLPGLLAGYPCIACTMLLLWLVARRMLARDCETGPGHISSLACTHAYTWRCVPGRYPRRLPTPHPPPVLVAAATSASPRYTRVSSWRTRVNGSIFDKNRVKSRPLRAHFRRDLPWGARSIDAKPRPTDLISRVRIV